MRFGLNPLWDSVAKLTHKSPLLMVLILIFSCTPIYMDASWFSLDPILYVVSCIGLILQTYVTREKAYNLPLTALSLVLLALTHYGYKTYGDIVGLTFALENAVYLWLYAMITLYFTSKGASYIGILIDRLKRIGMTLVTSILYTIVIIAIIWFVLIILGETFSLSSTIAKMLGALNIFICTTMICSYEEKVGGPPEPSPFFRTVFGVLIPKASIITGVLANVYLVLILVGLREDARFLYTYYPYVAIFYLFYLASFRSGQATKTQRILCFLFVSLTILCLALIGKRVVNEPVLWLNTVYLVLFNGIFLVYNSYTLLKNFVPGLHTSLMALVLGTVLFMPVLGYTSYYKFTSYRQIEGTWWPHFDIAKTFSPDYESYKHDLDLENKAIKEQDEKTRDNLVEFTSGDYQGPMSVEGYSMLIPSITLYSYDMPDKADSNSHADYDGISFDLVNKGTDLVVSRPDGSSHAIPIYDLMKAGVSTDGAPYIVEGKDFKLFIYRYYAKDKGARILYFKALYR